MSQDIVLQPWERLLVGVDTGPDLHCEVTMIQDTLTGKLRVVDVQLEPL